MSTALWSDIGTNTETKKNRQQPMFQCLADQYINVL